MNVIYYTDTQLPICQVAAQIHINRLPMDCIPSVKQLMQSLSGFKISGEGDPLPFGRDESGNEIFALNLGRAWSLGLQTVAFILSGHGNPLDWKFFKVDLALKFPVRAGTFISKRLRLDGLARKLAVNEIRKQYSEIVALVRKTKELSKSDG